MAKSGSETGYLFEEKNSVIGGRTGYADVFRTGAFAWENKTPDKNLDSALKQLLTCSLALSNPPILVVCDRMTIRIHTQFNGHPRARRAYWRCFGAASMVGTQIVGVRRVPVRWAGGTASSLYAKLGCLQPDLVGLDVVACKSEQMRGAIDHALMEYGILRQILVRVDALGDPFQRTGSQRAFVRSGNGLVCKTHRVGRGNKCRDELER